MGKVEKFVIISDYQQCESFKQIVKGKAQKSPSIFRQDDKFESRGQIANEKRAEAALRILD